MNMKRVSWSAVLVAAVVAAVVAVVSVRMVTSDGPQDEEARQRLDALEAGQQEILALLQEIKTTPPQEPAPAPAALPAPPPLPIEPMTIAGSATRGDVSARLAVVEFSDFECPFCGRYIRETFGQLDRDYVATGKLRYVFRNFPLERIHPNAFKAAVAGECVRERGAFWELHDRLFANQQALGDQDLLGHAGAVGMDGTAFKQCVGTEAVAAKVRQDLNDGARAGVTGTPTFFFGVVQADGRLKVLEKLTGAVPYARFQATIDTLLASPDVLN